MTDSLERSVREALTEMGLIWGWVPCEDRDRVVAEVLAAVRTQPITDEMVERVAKVIEKPLRYLGRPNTRMAGTEFVDCEEIARVALRMSLDEIGGRLDDRSA